MTDIPRVTDDPADHLLDSRIVEAWNEAARQVQRDSGPTATVPQLAEAVRQATHIKLKNSSGADRSRLAVLGIADVQFDPTSNSSTLRSFKSRVELVGEVPTEAEHFGRFAILCGALRNGRIGQAVIAGVTPVRVIITDTAHEFADVTDGSVATLTSAPYGAAQILWREGGTGEQWTVVRLGPPLAVAASIQRLAATLCSTMDGTLDATVSVHDAKLLGSTAAAPAVTEATNYLGLLGSAGDRVLLSRTPGSATGWIVDQVQHHAVQVINNVWDDGTNLNQGGLIVGAMYSHTPTTGCVIVETTTECEEGSGSGAPADPAFSLITEYCGESETASGDCSGSGVSE